MQAEALDALERGVEMTAGASLLAWANTIDSENRFRARRSLHSRDARRTMIVVLDATAIVAIVTRERSVEAYLAKATWL